jgi:hypothetical protein
MQIRTLLFSALFFFGIASVQAQANLSLQGTVQKSTGVSVDDGVYTLIFKLYTVETGGTPVWTEKQDSVVLLGGVYSVTLGAVTPLTAAFDKPYFLGITVGSGAELIPRARLTSSPYALSLIGQSNTFPSAGAVGAGTATPTAGYQLHVKNPDAEAKILIDGSSKSSIVFKKGANTQEMNYDGTKISVPGTLDVGTLNLTNPLTFTDVVANTYNTRSSNGPYYTVLGGNGLAARLSINNSLTYLYLNYGGGGEVNISNGAVLINDIGNSRTSPYVMHVKSYGGASAFFDGISVGPGFLSNSDQRIKKDIRYSKGAEDLQTLLKLRVADYRLIDDGAGAKVHKGFIAQEVEKILPDVVMTMTNVVPDINAFAQRLSLTGDQLTIVLDTKHGLQVGDRVSIGADKNSKNLFTVSKTESAQSFSVSEWASALPEKLLVYGREVKDFRSINYQEISNLNISATQELARRVAQLEAENAALRNLNQGLQKQNEGLRSDVNTLGSRLSKLENLITSKGQR